MWKLWNKLFGWDYVLLRASMMDYRYIRRVRQNVAGARYVKFCGQDLWFLNDDGKTDNGYLWTALTW